MQCEASATPGGVRCWCRVETKWRWKENNNVGARSEEGYFGVLVTAREKIGVWSRWERVGRTLPTVPSPHLWKEHVVNTNGKNERALDG
jgi:hypothetical protein